MPTTRLPRKVLIGTCIFPHYGDYPGLEARLAEIAPLLDAMGAEAANRDSGKSLDLMVLPEQSVTGGNRPGTEMSAADQAMHFDGEIAEFFAHYARKYNCYITVPMSEMRENGEIYNSMILVDRSGARVGSYDKCLPVVDHSWNALEAGITSGKNAPVFECDFGRLGMQICFDIENAATWKQLESGGAELVVWGTASPQTLMPQSKALNHGYWVVSATMRDNATVFQPHTGFTHAQITEPGILVSEIDLSTLHLHWMPDLENGQGFTTRFGDKVGYQYRAQEDNGLFWSNDPEMSICDMAEAIGVFEQCKRVERSRELNPHC